MVDSGMGPQYRLSQESSRLSPMTNTSRTGILKGRCSAYGFSEGPGVVDRWADFGSQGSANRLPLMYTWPPEREMVSPGSPITRFTRSATGGPPQSSSAGRENTTMLDRKS